MHRFNWFTWFACVCRKETWDFLLVAYTTSTPLIKEFLLSIPCRVRKFSSNTENLSSTNKSVSQSPQAARVWRPVWTTFTSVVTIVLTSISRGTYLPFNYITWKQLRSPTIFILVIISFIIFFFFTEYRQIMEYQHGKKLSARCLLVQGTPPRSYGAVSQTQFDERCPGSTVSSNMMHMPMPMPMSAQNVSELIQETGQTLPQPEYDHRVAAKLLNEEGEDRSDKKNSSSSVCECNDPYFSHRWTAISCRIWSRLLFSSRAHLYYLYCSVGHRRYRLERGLQQV